MPRWIPSSWPSASNGRFSSWPATTFSAWAWSPDHRYLVAPIPIVKSQMDLRTLRQIRETIRDGGLVGLFPEGNRSFHGRTMFIPPSTGKLVKQLGCTVLLYRLTAAT
jgi:1-acyl-sn-glycerol-3-phosphate acyltransferase